MSRLITFGCSYTFGHGLEDCYIPPDKEGPNPSKLAWPSLLGNMLNLEVINCSNPGASNTHILWKLLNFEFKNEDICVVMWTHFGRYPFSNLQYDSSIVIWKKYETSVFQSPHVLDKENLCVRNYMLIHHGYLYLQSKNLKHHFMIAPREASEYIIPNNINIPTLNKKSMNHNFWMDTALDKKHPGPKTHENVAKELFSKLNAIH